jgi:predicted nucleic acid-binding protein
MAVVCDTGAVYALYDADDLHHAAYKTGVEAERGPLFLPIVLLADIDYLLASRLGIDMSAERRDSCPPPSRAS